ncbi:TetR family transcriptional regulator [Microterricola gilva]|uniref:TetR family transcriptional regulator n=1 Tax=Microterricola gilva TaxID=393267 RepID=A0A4Q8AR88_9MICO|nr:TetR/AcrR family transcriptional regulator [Microterricola gilva]RZU66653.1 TetR family transcriptional regulator [Microterricola gilva]
MIASTARSASTSTARSTETRERILSIAAEEFAERGYAGTSIGGIAERAGVGKGLVQYHFKAKVDLALEIVQGAYAQASFANIIGSADPLRGLAAIVTSIRTVARAFREDVRVRAATRLLREHDVIPATFPTPYVSWVAVIAQCLIDAADDGEIPSRENLATEAWHLVANFYGVQEVSQRLTQREDLPERIEEMLEREFILLGVFEPRRFLVESPEDSVQL